VNLAYSILGEQFANWVKERINERNSKLTIERNLNIEMDPEIARAFMLSTSVSCK
jgi:DNA/RNA endonuclease G (NUC1)